MGLKITILSSTLTFEMEHYFYSACKSKLKIDFSRGSLMKNAAALKNTVAQHAFQQDGPNQFLAPALSTSVFYAVSVSVWISPGCISVYSQLTYQSGIFLKNCKG